MKIDALVKWYETLSPDTIAEIGGIYHEDARFRDPFNDVIGHEAIAAVFLHMFETTSNPVFRISETQLVDNTAWVSWVFEFGLRGKGLAIEGSTRLRFASDGRVIEHRDFWDATDLFDELYLVGTITRFLKRRLRAQHPRG